MTEGLGDCFKLPNRPNTSASSSACLCYCTSFLVVLLLELKALCVRYGDGSEVEDKEGGEKSGIMNMQKTEWQGLD